MISGTRLPLLPFYLACGLLLATGVCHGLWTQRWQPSRELEAAVARLDGLPGAMGNWNGEAVEPDPEALAQSGLAACQVRNYVERNRGSRVTVFLMCGRAGPASVHTPEWCYRGAGYEMTSPPARFTLPLEGGKGTADFWTARFAKPAPAANAPLRIFWSWNAAATWVAPAHPRLTFGRYPALYKLYFVHDDLVPSESLDHAPAVAFMRSFLPELGRILFPESDLPESVMGKEWKLPGNERSLGSSRTE